jgi:predicted nucleic acid-binding protein
MGWLEDMYGKVIGLDTAPIIYFVEERSHFGIVQPFFEALSRGYFRAITSIITLLEVLVQPYHHEDSNLAEKYKEILLHSDNLFIVPVSSEIADKAAEFRARYGIRTPDAIQIATALQGGSSIFMTNSRSLKKIQEIEVITLCDIEKA